MEKFDAIIIGAGMSGLAAGIRLSMYEKKVLILEKHTIAGGLNSYYQRKNSDAGGIRKFDVGLHALTNFIKKGEKHKPLSKLLKQLRLSYDDLKLQPQSFSTIVFPDTILKFNNEFEMFQQDVFDKFPKSIDEFNQLVQKIKEYNEVALSNPQYLSAKDVVSSIIKDQKLVEMIFCPLLIYGSAWEDDMDFSQFVIMFKSIFFEGFARPTGGVRTIIDLLLNKYKENGGQIRFKAAVEKINYEGQKIVSIKLADGSLLTADQIFSSIGLPETQRLFTDVSKFTPARAGVMSFMETLLVFDKKVSTQDFGATIAFYNNRQTYHYRKSTGLYDSESAVFCVPDNYDFNDRSGEGMIRITNIANYDLWKKLERAQYNDEKNIVLENAKKLVKKLIPNFDAKLLFTDIFSPTTVERFTSHKNGAVYGSLDKSRDGKTQFQNLFIIGTDQGFLGIVGAMLSGISMANLYGLMGSNEL